MEDLIGALKQCYDPEIPINIVDLGLIYGIEEDDGKIHVRMTLTSRGCSAGEYLADTIKEKLSKVAGVKLSTVEIVWDPPWTPERMSEEAKKMMTARAEELRRRISHDESAFERPVEVTDSMRPVKKGEVRKNEDGSLSLVNDKNESFRVTKETLMFWEMCDGTRTVADLGVEIGRKLGMNPDELKPMLIDLARNLIDYRLVAAG